MLDPRFIYYEINEDLEKYSEEMDVPKVKESVEKLKRLNGDAKFINNITPGGVAKGRAEEKLGIATNLLKQNIPIEQISLATSLSKKELKKISENNKKV